MKALSSLSLQVDHRGLRILDQTLLPNQEKWLLIETVEQMIEAIKALRVRGAPLIGVAAALSLARQVEGGADRDDFFAAALALREARPTAVNLMIAIDRMTSEAEREYSAHRIVAAAEAIFAEDVALCERIARLGASAIADGDHVLTHCNSGGLATAGVGTALGAILTAHALGKKIHVYVDETRPLLQGGRLTSWELQKMGVPYTLICDNMAAMLMAQGKVQKIFVGADRIARNGDFANKVGTYGLAVSAHFHKVPFFVCAPVTTVDVTCGSGAEIPIEQRSPAEVRGVKGSFGDVCWAPADAQVYNPAFDVTPAKLVSGWILDRGHFNQQDVREGALVKGE